MITPTPNTGKSHLPMNQRITQLVKYSLKNRFSSDSPIVDAEIRLLAAIYSIIRAILKFG
ncbi:hypothetical protein Riv7116_3910 [Rivularia sp. PCC 7116]|nr:hypothetical protein Riv7116_3910 [Rivularia sp. PCC 7116]